jgi:hypothetical protein
VRAYAAASGRVCNAYLASRGGGYWAQGKTSLQQLPLAQRAPIAVLVWMPSSAVPMHMWLQAACAAWWRSVLQADLAVACPWVCEHPREDGCTRLFHKEIRLLLLQAHTESVGLWQCELLHHAACALPSGGRQARRCHGLSSSSSSSVQALFNRRLFSDRQSTVQLSRTAAKWAQRLHLWCATALLRAAGRSAQLLAVFWISG